MAVGHKEEDLRWEEGGGPMGPLGVISDPSVTTGTCTGPRSTRPLGGWVGRSGHQRAARAPGLPGVARGW